VKVALVFSKRDPAGHGAAKYVAERLGASAKSTCPRASECFEASELIIAGFDEDVIHFDFLDEVFGESYDLYVVLSRHSSEASVKSYTVHFTGNFGSETLYGGRPHELGVAHPLVGWVMLRHLRELAKELRREDYEVSYEATHHGPTNLSKPLVFVEIGSSLNEWSDTVNHAVIGESVVKFIEHRENLPECTSTIGIGGGHYPRKHTELALTSDTCFGHILPKYGLPHLSTEVLENMYNRSALRPVQIVVEKKGTRQEHRLLIEEFARKKSLRVHYI